MTEIEDLGNNEWRVGETVLHRVHSAYDCSSGPCVLHRPTDHHMRDWDIEWNDAQKVFYRKCPHGQDILDPDQYGYLGLSRMEPLCCGNTLKGGPKVQCAECGDIIRSMTRHDFVTCGCGATFVDGGTDYLRTGGAWVEL